VVVPAKGSEGTSIVVTEAAAGNGAWEAKDPLHLIPLERH